jgi:hypothetical protein
MSAGGDYVKRSCVWHSGWTRFATKFLGLTTTVAPDLASSFPQVTTTLVVDSCYIRFIVRTLWPMYLALPALLDQKRRAHRMPREGKFRPFCMFAAKVLFNSGLSVFHSGGPVLGTK